MLAPVPRRLSWTLALLALTPFWAVAEPRLPVFDVHIHYSQAAWQQYPPQTVVEVWNQAGIERAIVSSTPDDGTVLLYEAAPQRVVPFLRPYRGQWNSGNWYEDPGLMAYLQERLKLGIHKGIGEFHMFNPAGVDTSGVRAVVKLAVERNLYLYIHSGAEAAGRLAALDPQAKVLWAHAGMSEPPDVVAAVLAKYPNVWTETSFRAGDISGGSGIDPAWKALLMKYRDRIMVDSDTYVTSRLANCGELIDEHRRWLSQLPPDVAEQLAWRNAARLFGTGGRVALEK